jgi:hypothetical protein
MKRFIVAGAFAVVLGLGFSGKADAQIVYNSFAVPNAGGVVTGGTMMTPGATRTFNNFYSPFTGTMVGQSMTTNVFGQAAVRNYGYNAFTGMGFRNGVVQPNVFANPFGGFTYSNVYRRW